MSVYLRRAVKYLVYLLAMFALIFAVMDLIGNQPGEQLRSEKGMIISGLILVMAIIYPLIGFVQREVKADIVADREKIVQAFRASGFVVETQSETQIVFHAENILKRFINMWEDRIVIDKDDNYIVISGIRKEVVRIEFRLKGML